MVLQLFDALGILLENWLLYITLMTTMASPIVDGIQSYNQLSELNNWFKLGHPDVSTTQAFELVDGKVNNVQVQQA